MTALRTEFVCTQEYNTRMDDLYSKVCGDLFQLQEIRNYEVCYKDAAIREGDQVEWRCSFEVYAKDAAV